MRGVGDLLAGLERAAEARDAGISTEHRSRRGIVHTPPAVARWIARAAGPVVGASVVDPACGPGIFLAALLEAGGADGPAACLGIDVDPQAIAVAERELRGAFEAAGWPLALEARDALAAVPALDGRAIVVGNPPWTARTASRGVTDALLDDFRRGPDAADLGERKIGVLSDAYVRFVRWALAVVERAPGGGVIAMVVSASWLDGRVHRGMRGYLLDALDRITLVDLGGSALVARASGVRDENVFGVRPGAVIVVGVRDPGEHARSASVRSVRLRGSKEDKLAALDALAFDHDARFERLAPAAPLYRFVPSAHAAMPDGWPTIDAWMPWSREGVQTNRDAICIADTREALLAGVHAFIDAPDASLARGHFDPEAAAARLREEKAPLEQFVSRIAYRPLEERWLFTHPALCHRARPEIAEALAHEPLALVTASKDRGERAFAHLGIVDAIADNCWLSSRSSCRARLYPARTPDGEENVGAGVRAQLETIAGRRVSAREVIAYLAAWLSAASFRARYDEALRIGPPRVPLPISRAAFEPIARAGAGVVAAFTTEPRERLLPLGPLVIGHRELRGSARTEAVAQAQREADAAVRDLVVSPP